MADGPKEGISVRISILGKLDLADDDGNTIGLSERRPQPLVRALLCVLALRGQSWTGSQLKGLLWDDDERDLTSTWTSLIYRTRHVLPPRRLITESGAGGAPHYRLQRDADDIVDVDRFRDAMLRAYKARGVADFHAMAAHCAEALDQWRTTSDAPLLPDFPETFLMQQHPDYLQLLHQYRDATEGYAEAKIQIGEHGPDLADTIHHFIIHQPVNSKLHLLRMAALYLAGRKGEALAAHQEAHILFDRHVGAPPGPELDQIHERIARDDAVLESCAGFSSALPSI